MTRHHSQRRARRPRDWRPHVLGLALALAIGLGWAGSANAEESLELLSGDTVVCDVLSERAGVLEVVGADGVAYTISGAEVRKRSPLTPPVAALFFHAVRGDAEAQTQLGIAFEAGDGVLPNALAAAHFYREAAGQGHPKGMGRWAWALDQGLGTKVDMPAAHAWYARAAEHGDVFAQARHTALSKSPALQTAALSYYRAADRQGDGRATYFVAKYLELGRDVQRNRVASRSTWRRGALAGDPGCMLQYGLSLLRSPTSRAEVTAGRTWVRKAAARKDGLAMFTLGRVYHRGELGFAQNTRFAEPWLRQSAAAGVHQAMAELGLLLRREDRAQEARVWLARAFNLGNRNAAPQLGSMFEHGHGGPETPALAAGLYRAAADNGDRTAIAGLVRLLESGRCAPLNRHELGHWRYKLAAAQHVEDGLRGQATTRPAAPAAKPLWLTTALTLREHLISISMVLGILFMVLALRHPQPTLRAETPA